MNNKFTKTLATLLVFCLSMRSLAPSLNQSLKADEETTREIHIKSEADFIEFSKNCQLDTYSAGLTCILDKDLDFKGKKFIAVPIFSGTFDGKNHKIKGVKIKDSGSILGIFRINQGNISNLRVACDMEPTESSNKLGIIAGENRGQIDNCRCTGYIKGDEEIGGIAGINTENATISNCTSDVYITGTVHVGGITGLNQGSIIKCTNNGNINVSEDQINESDISNLLSVNSMNTVEPDFLGDDLKSDKDVFSCVGGIAGRNNAYIKKAINNGRIGYMHIGANIGGIAGISNGFIENSKNTGSIDGRKNIGGIAGQFEPNVDIQYTDSSIEALHQQNKLLVEKLRSLNEKAYNTTTNTLDKGEKINTTSKDLQEYLHTTGNEVNNFSQEKVDEVYDASIKISDNNKTLIDNFDKYSKLILDGAQAVTDDANEISNQLNELTTNMNDNMAEIREAIVDRREAIREQVDRLLEIQEYTGEAKLKMLSNKKEFPKIMESYEKIKELNKKLPPKAQIKAAMVQYKTNPLGLTAEQKQILKNVNTIKSEKAKIDNFTNDSTVADNMGETVYITFDAAEKILEEVEEINDVLEENSANIIDTNTESLKIIKETSDKLKQDSDKLLKDTDEFNKIMVDGLNFDHTELRKIQDNSKVLFDFNNDKFANSNEKIYEDTSTINQDVANLISDSRADTAEINQLTGEIINNFDKMADIMYDLSQKPDYETVNLFDYKEGMNLNGTIIFSKNDGIINGDHNIGGIAGMVDMEVANDTKEQFKLEDNKWQSTNIVERAIIYKSQNNGTIKAKDNYAGGITGKAMTGYVYDSSNKGNVEGKDYLGGISGYTEGDILNCDVLCDVTGDNHVGGIGGYTNNISNNRAMVRVFADGENIGAIAGETEADSEILDNIFVKELVGGIDNTSYAGKAYPVAYEDFIKLDNLPVYFDNIYVKFYDGKKLIKSVKVKFNGSIKASEIPPTKYNNNTYSEWEEFNMNNISSSKDVYLLHKPWLSTISSAEKVPMFLAEGKFSPNAKIDVESLEYQFRKEDYEAAKEYKYTITDSMKGEADSYKIRVKLKEGEQVKRIVNKKVENINYTMDGSYAVFEGKSTGNLLIVTPNYVEYLAFAIIGGILLLIVLIFLIRFLRRRTRKRLERKGLI